MPGLLRGVARTAVIAGTATHVSNNVSRRQAKAVRAHWGSRYQSALDAAASRLAALGGNEGYSHYFAFAFKG